MANVFAIFTPHTCLDEEFDAPDLAADCKLCRDMAAGRWGLHPDVWGSHDPLTTMPPPWRHLQEVRRRYETHDPDWVAKWSRPLREPPPPKPPKPPKPPYELWPDPARWVPRRFGDNVNGGVLQLTCDDCDVPFPVTRSYGPGERDDFTAAIRRMGKPSGWTCIVGRDRCPECSQIAPPEAVGDGAGAGQRNK